MPNFKILDEVVLEKSLMKSFHMHNKGVRDKKEKWKKGKISCKHLDFLIHSGSTIVTGIPKFKKTLDFRLTFVQD